MRRAELLSVSCLVFCSFISCNLFEAKPTPECNPLGPQPNLRLIATKVATKCLNPDGELIVEAIGGRSPYKYTIDDRVYLSQGQFAKLYAGDYRIKVVDANGCVGFLRSNVGSTGTVLSATAVATPDDKCFSDNGSIIVKARNGVSPYQYKFEGNEFVNDSVFSTLKSGFYKIEVTDGQNCKTSVAVKVGHGFSGVSYIKDIVPIINSKCANAGCHNGDVGFNINFTVYNNLKSYASIIKAMVSLRRPHMNQPPLLDQEIQYISCWVEDGTLKN
jgi:hypothetical protein